MANTTGNHLHDEIVRLESGSIDGDLLEDTTLTGGGKLSNLCNSRHFEKGKKDERE
jgi:hypothetical protein